MNENKLPQPWLAMVWILSILFCLSMWGGVLWLVNHWY